MFEIYIICMNYYGCINIKIESSSNMGLIGNIKNHVFLVIFLINLEKVIFIFNNDKILSLFNITLIIYSNNNNKSLEDLKFYLICSISSCFDI